MTKPNISESEWKIMKCLWNSPGPMEIKDLIAALEPETHWNGNTIRTLVVRLIEKGAVAAEKEKKVFRYRPALEEGEVCLEETDSFLEKVYGGSAPKLFAALTNGGRLTARDVEEIERMIAQMKKRGQ